MALLGGRIARWSYRYGLQGKLGVTTYDIRLAGETRFRTPLRIAFASDFHAGPTTDPTVFSLLFSHLSELQPDVLLLGGDFVSCKSTYVAALTDGLQRCRPPLGKFAVLGNHDLWADEQQLTSLLTATGVQVLVNRNATLPAPCDFVSVCGLDDPWAGAADAARTFSGSTDIRLFLTHAPDGLLMLNTEQFAVGFAGHTHGGQIARRNGTPIVLPHGPLSCTYVYGKFDLKNNGCLIVSRGIGCSTLPIRINADPELVICTIVNEGGGAPATHRAAAS